MSFGRPCWQAVLGRCPVAPHLEIKDKSEHSMPIPPEHHPVFLSFGRPCWQAVLGRCPIAPHLEIKDKSEHSMPIPPEHHPVFLSFGRPCWQAVLGRCPIAPHLEIKDNAHCGGKFILELSPGRQRRGGTRESSVRSTLRGHKMADQRRRDCVGMTPGWPLSGAT